MNYQVLLDGQVIFEGNQIAISERFDARREAVSSCVREGHRLKRKYTIIKKKYEVGDTLQYLIKHLDKYDSTPLNVNPEPYIKQLKELGIDATYTKKLDDGVIKRKTYWYLVERKNK